MAIGFAQAAAAEPENVKLKAYADALHAACVNVLKKGIATPDLVSKLRSAQKTGVDTASFVKAVRVELLTLLGLQQQAEDQKRVLRETMREIR